MHRLTLQPNPATRDSEPQAEHLVIGMRPRGNPEVDGEALQRAVTALESVLGH
jgi:hypothetical protein